MTFDNTDHAPIEVRRFVGACLAAWGVTVVDGRIILAVSELTTNAVVHGSGPIDVTVDATSDRLRVTVSDHGNGTPTLHNPNQSERDSGGWGLHLVDMLVDDWGIERRQQRIIVWFEHGLPAD